jgi:hypothetical protein
MSELCDGLSRDEVNGVLEVCTSVLVNLSHEHTRNRDKILELLKVFARTGNTVHVDRILNAAQNTLHFQINRSVHSAIVHELMNAGHLLQVSTWLKDMPSKPGQLIPRVDIWDEFLDRCIAQGQFTLFRVSMDYLLDQQKIKLKPKTYKLFFEAIFRFNHIRPPSLPFVQSLLDRMKQDNIPFSRAMMDVLVDGYRKLNADQAVQAIENIYNGMQDVAPVSADAIDHTANLVETLSQIGASAAEGELARSKARGFVPTSATLDAMAAHIITVKDLHRWETLLHVPASPSAWLSVLRNVSIHCNSPKDAVSAYRGFLSYGFFPTPAAIHPVVRAICTKELRLPSRGAVTEALKLHREYILHLERSAHQLPARYSPQDDLPVYNTLLRATTSSPQFYPFAVDLLEEMKGRGIVMNFATTRSVIPLLLRVAPDVQAAFRIYQDCRQNLDGQYTLNEHGFHTVLDVFCKSCISLPEHVELYMSIVKDLRRAGYPVTVQIYTHVLRKLGTLAVDLKGDHNQSQEVAVMVKRVHNAITLDPSIRPDTIMWNQLMDTYQRAGCFREAYVVWESLYVARTFDNASVSIIMDACSYAGASELAIEIFAKLHAAEFPLNQSNWSNWIEALCRLGHLSEATKVLCIAMPKQQDVHPTVEIARLILKFAIGLNQQSEVRQRIKHYLPSLYSKLL